MLDAVGRVSADQIILLPNDKNIILAAEQVKQLTTKDIRVIPSRTVPQGIAALLAFNYQADVASNVTSMTSAISRVRTIELTRAVRSAKLHGITVHEGQPIALLDGDLVAAGDDLNALLLQALELGGARDSEIVTLYCGSEVVPAVAEQTRALVAHTFPELEVEVLEGGQPLYPFIISIE
jgi:dihydroxyacetone kinase-like predicted kinase